jgi:hypothetical protein
VARAVVLVVALLGLALAAVWTMREPARSARLAAAGGAAGGFVIAWAVAVLAGKATLDALAIGLLGGAVLPLALLGQMRLIRALTARR